MGSSKPVSEVNLTQCRSGNVQKTKTGVMRHPAILITCAPRPVVELFCSNFQTATESVLLTTEAVSESYPGSTRCQNTFSRGEWELYTRV
jgi:hypothetical protein